MKCEAQSLSGQCSSDQQQLQEGGRPADAVAATAATVTAGECLRRASESELEAG